MAPRKPKAWDFYALAEAIQKDADAMSLLKRMGVDTPKARQEFALLAATIVNTLPRVQPRQERTRTREQLRTLLLKAAQLMENDPELRSACQLAPGLTAFASPGIGTIAPQLRQWAAGVDFDINDFYASHLRGPRGKQLDALGMVARHLDALASQHDFPAYGRQKTIACLCSIILQRQISPRQIKNRLEP